MASGRDVMDYHIEKLFSLIDVDNDGSITVQELSDRLHITFSEALAIVQETEAQDDEGETDVQLTLAEFKTLIKKMDRSHPDEKELPLRVVQRYRMIFDSLDHNHSGSVHVRDLFKDMGVHDQDDQDDMLDVVSGNEEIDFEQFLELMRAGENQAFQNMRSALERSKTFQQPRDPKPFLEVWRQCEAVDGRADVAVVRALLFSAQASGELDIDSEELLESVFLLDLEADENEGAISRKAFLDSLGVVDRSSLSASGGGGPGTRNKLLARALTHMHANQHTMISMAPELPSETLTEEELELYHSLFAELDADRDGFVSAADLQGGVERLIQKHLLEEDERRFFFELLTGISASVPELDFEQFVVLLQEASERTCGAAGSAWTAQSALRLIQGKHSRHAQVRVLAHNAHGVVSAHSAHSVVSAHSAHSARSARSAATAPKRALSRQSHPGLQNTRVCGMELLGQNDLCVIS